MHEKGCKLRPLGDSRWMRTESRLHAMVVSNVLLRLLNETAVMHLPVYMIKFCLNFGKNIINSDTSLNFESDSSWSAEKKILLKQKFVWFLNSSENGERLFRITITVQSVASRLNMHEWIKFDENLKIKIIIYVSIMYWVSISYDFHAKQNSLRYDLTGYLANNWSYWIIIGWRMISS